MAAYIIGDGVVWELDPLGKHREKTTVEFLNGVGLIPTFFNPRVTGEEEVIAYALGAYGYNPPEMLGGRILRDGTYEYPGDPPLYPLAYTDVGSTRVFIYEYGIVEFVSKNGTHVYRMD